MIGNADRSTRSRMTHNVTSPLQLPHAKSVIRTPRRRWPEGWAGTLGPPESALQSRNRWDKLCVPSRSACDAGAMQQIADWLQKLGLGQYAQRFAENDINFAVLPHLTDQDL